MIVLNFKAQLTVDVIAKVAERKITIANATKLLITKIVLIELLRKWSWDSPSLTHTWDNPRSHGC